MRRPNRGVNALRSLTDYLGRASCETLCAQRKQRLAIDGQPPWLLLCARATTPDCNQ